MSDEVKRRSACYIQTHAGAPSVFCLSFILTLSGGDGLVLVHRARLYSYAARNLSILEAGTLANLHVATHNRVLHRDLVVNDNMIHKDAIGHLRTAREPVAHTTAG